MEAAGSSRWCAPRRIWLLAVVVLTGALATPAAGAHPWIIQGGVFLGAVGDESAPLGALNTLLNGC